MEFELPLSGGDVRGEQPEVRLGDLAPLLERHLPDGDPVRAYAEPLRGDLGDQPLRGYLTGSVDVVLRVASADGPRYVIVDYKTNWLGPRDEPLTALSYRPEALDAAMGHSDYPLQALLYAAVLHRFLRWRQPGYDPERAPRRRALPLPARHVRARDARWSTGRRAGSSPGGRRSPWSTPCPTCSTGW